MKAAAFLIAGALFGIAEARAFTLQVDQGNALIYGWESSEITFDVNSADCVAAGVSVDEVNGAIDRAIELWNSVPASNLRLKRGGSSAKTASEIKAQTTGGNPLILCDASLGADLAGPGEDPVTTNSIPAAARVLRINGSRQISLAVVYINAEPGKPASVSQVARIPDLLPIVLAHEIGHAVGLGHSADHNALMYFDATSRTTLSLAEDDVNGITYLYPRKEIGNAGLFGCGTISRPGGPGGKDKDGGPASLLLGLFLCWGIVAWAKLRERQHVVSSLSSGADAHITLFS